ncbi:MAG: hypothetical protein KME15_19850 [Drouetiella hepatica Uher 2000/2452]|jgi:hypothetical protein|uniref:Uncharacterized protein n=1 Tax=Drouetiella hepatica Uher 2000/2452 TaxID=904376 RepID=A0A951UP45_9CYAN|nr:hypothetical protein [Drouetiella hepatica Uher 2000/2452]
MPLSDRQEHLLFELYGIPYSSKTISLGSNGLASMPPLTELHQSAKDRLQEAILEINIDPFKTERVGEILAEYEGISLDPSTIEREGYSFRFGRSISNLKDRLYAYTGIRVAGSFSNRMPLG